MENNNTFTTDFGQGIMQVKIYLPLRHYFNFHKNRNYGKVKRFEEGGKKRSDQNFERKKS